MGIVSLKLKELFYYLGENVISVYPKCCIVGPIVISLLLGCGLFNLKFVSDLEFLYTPANGQSKSERAVVENYFRVNYSGGFDISRSTRLGRFSRIIITAKDGGTLLNSKIWTEILQLDNTIKGVSLEAPEGPRDYSSLCARWEESCYENDILDLNSLMDRIENGSLRLSYPIMFNYENFKTYPLPKYFGGVILKEDNSSVARAHALLLQYIIAVNTDDDDVMGKLWEVKLAGKLLETRGLWKSIEVNFLTKESFPQEINKSIGSIVPHFVVTSFLMVMFTMGSSMMRDWVTSKPWLGVMGFISSLLGTLAGYGLMTYIGIPFADINLSVPFIMMGIGIDDTFVMLASWRQTTSDDPVPKRIANCYSEAAVSITITSLTDMLSFFVGILTPIPSIQIFSLYAGTCVLFIYLWQIFLLGGAMTISGYHEQAKRHSLLFWKKVVPFNSSKAESMSSLHRIFFTGADKKISSSNQNLTESSENMVMMFFKDNFSSFITTTWVKLVIIGISILYLYISYWGICTMKEGLQQERLVPYGSYVAEFLQKENKFFKEFSFRIQLVVSTPLDYSEPTIQSKISQILEEFYKVDNISKEYTENWLRDFLQYVKLYGEFEEFNVTTENEFIHVLRQNFLKPHLPISTDVHFNQNKSQIIASRFILQSHNILNSTLEKDLVLNLREVAKKVGGTLGINVTVYHPFFDFADQFIVIRELTIKLMVLAAAVVMIVTITFIPNLICCLCVFITIASIEVGVLGFMSLWDVSLDLFSINCIIMCIGFSVDFSAHICYAYISANKEIVPTSEMRLRSALHSLGMPILQGGISTVIGVLALVVAPSYTFLTFFKIIFLVICFATWHALFLLPVALTLIRPEQRFMCSRKKSYNLAKILTSEQKNSRPQITVEKLEVKYS